MFCFGFLIWVGLSNVNGAVFESAGAHEGIVVLRQDMVYSSNDMVRIRMDISLTKWIAYDKMLQELTLTPVLSGVRETVTKRVKELAQVRELLGVNKWIQHLRLSKQPLLLLLPNEAVGDAFARWYVSATKTYGLNSSCDTIIDGLEERSSRLEWVTVLENLKTKGTTTAAPSAGRRK